MQVERINAEAKTFRSYVLRIQIETLEEEIEFRSILQGTAHINPNIIDNESKSNAGLMAHRIDQVLMGQEEW